MLDWKFDQDQLTLAGEIIAPALIRKLEEMQPVLLDRDAQGPEVVYRAYRDIPDPDKPEGMQADLTVIPAGRLGREFTKTHGHYHIGEGVEYYKLLRGAGMMLMQKPTFDFKGVEAVRLVKLTPQQDIQVPSGWGHTIINVGSDNLVTVNYENPEIKPLYSAYDDHHGAAYYLVDTGNGSELEPNPNYGNVPKPQSF